MISTVPAVEISRLLHFWNRGHCTGPKCMPAKCGAIMSQNTTLHQHQSDYMIGSDLVPEMSEIRHKNHNETMKQIATNDFQVNHTPIRKATFTNRLNTLLRKDKKLYHHSKTRIMAISTSKSQPQAEKSSRRENYFCTIQPIQIRDLQARERWKKSYNHSILHQVQYQ